MPTKLINQGLIEVRKGEVETAINTFSQVVKLFPKHSLAHFYLANLYTIRDDKEQALSFFGKSWNLGNNLQNHYQLIPSKSLFLLLSMDPVPTKDLETWVQRAAEFYDEYTVKEQLMINFANQKLKEANSQTYSDSLSKAS